MNPYDYPVKYTCNWHYPIRWQGPGLYRFNNLWVEWWKADDDQLNWFILTPATRGDGYRFFTPSMICDNPNIATPAIPRIELHNPKFAYFSRFYDSDGCCKLHGNSYLNPDWCDCFVHWQTILDNMTPDTPGEIERIRQNWNALGIAY